jgi:hypothetical protein
MIKHDISSDYRVQELLMALNEGLLDAEFVKRKLTDWAGSQVDLIHHSDGEFEIVIERDQRTD